MREASDEELVARALADPRGPWLDELFQRHYRRVALWCLRHTGDRDAAADLAQEVFVRVQSNLPSFAGQARFSTWLYTICRNHCLNAVKARRPTDGVEEEADFGGTRAPEMEAELDRAGQAEKMREWVASLLDETERRVFVLHYGEEMPLASITRLLGLTNASGAKAHVVSARRKLQEAVRRWRGRDEKR